MDPESGPHVRDCGSLGRMGRNNGVMITSIIGAYSWVARPRPQLWRGAYQINLLAAGDPAGRGLLKATFISPNHCGIVHLALRIPRLVGNQPQTVQRKRASHLTDPILATQKGKKALPPKPPPLQCPQGQFLTLSQPTTSNTLSKSQSWHHKQLLSYCFQPLR